jgi:hypothetical protein
VGVMDTAAEVDMAVEEMGVADTAVKEVDADMAVVVEEEDMVVEEVVVEEEEDTLDSNCNTVVQSNHTGISNE